MYQCARDNSISLPHLAATQLLKETIPFNNKHVTYFVSTSHIIRGERERERELISTYDNCRTFVRCRTRGRVILIPIDSII